MLNVAIATDIPGETGRAAPVVSKSCEAVVGTGRCPLSQDLGPSNIVAWYAVVRADDAEGARVRIEFRDRSLTGALVETRDLVFSERDAPDSRWASAGAVIAAFVTARDAPEAASPGARPPELRIAPPSAEPGIPWGCDLALITGPGLDQGAYRLGALGRGFVGLPQAPNVFGALSLRYAQRPGDLDVTWMSASAGIGARADIRDTAFSLELLGELVLERVAIMGRNDTTGHEGTSAQNRFGGRLGSNVGLRIWRGFAFLVGAEVSALRPAVEITFLDASAGRVPAVQFAGTVGIRFRL
jgi:hypothetical protein